MDDAVLVRVVKRIRDLARDRQRLLEPELSLALELGAQRLAADVGQDVPEKAV